MSRTSRRAKVALASAVGLLLVTVPSSQSAASDPAESALIFPANDGESVTSEYTGTAPPGVLGAADGCTAANSDTHTLQLTVPPGTYDEGSAVLSFLIRWEPVAGNDLILSVQNEAGEEVGSSDGGTPEETVTLIEPAAGVYTALVCGFASATPQPYEGVITATKTPPAPEAFPTVARGLDFSPSLVTDPQRSQGESAAFADDQGVLYSCGTNGASNGTDHGSVSVDGGETWRPLGTPPVGETGTVQGGGDCAIATGQDPNEEGNRQLAFIGLGPLTGFSTFTSPDNGRTLQRSPSQNGLEPTDQRSLVDRQWLVFTDEDTVILNYNAALLDAPSQVPDGIIANGQVVQISDDGGLTYGPQIVASTDGGRLGQIRAIKEGTIAGQTDDIVYFPYSSGTKVKLALSKDAGKTWSQCLAVDAQADPTAGFVAADHDSAGNVYVTYTEKGAGNDTYLVALRGTDLTKCEGPAPVGQSADNNVNPGFTDRIRINTNGIETTVMPWVAAGGAPGRAAVSYYGTPSIGNPDSGDFKATWHVYVNQTLDVFAAEPQFEQVQATTHPNHYDSICLGGLGCDIPDPETGQTGDRSLVDYFTMAYDPATGRLLGVYNQAAKIAGEPEGNIAAPVALVQRAGPSNNGGTLTPGPEVVRTGSVDKAGDGIPRWTTDDGLLGSPTVGAGGGTNQPALDLLNVQVGPEVDLETEERVENGGFTVTMTYDDLSPGALTAALEAAPGSSLVYLFRFFDGFQPGGATAHFEGGSWRFGYNDYEITVRNPQGNVQTYEGSTPIEGAVDEQAGTIRLSVPRELIEALEENPGPDQHPKEVVATEGSRIYDGSAWSFVNPLPTSEGEQSFLYQSDNSSAFDFLLGAEPDPLVAAAREILDACPPERVPEDNRTDVAASNTHESAVDCMVWWEIAQGTSSTMYEPSKAVTRAQMASFVARLIEKSGGELPADAEDAFTDDDGLAPHEQNINKLAAAGIVSGKGDGLYDPAGPVTRAQMAKFLVEGYEFRSENALTSAGDYFDDDDGSVHEANINKAATAGFTAGRNGGYDPSASVLRDQMASFLARTLDLLVEEGTTPPKA